MIECDTAIVAWFLDTFGSPSRGLVALHMERRGTRLPGAVGVTVKMAKPLRSRHRYQIYGLSGESVI